jgi:RNA polymerase sigma factor (sigma-70 family)
MSASKREVEDAVRRISQLHGRAMVNVAARYERDSRDVEEIVSAALELAYRNWDALATATDENVRGWLLRTTDFLCRNHVRRAVTRRRVFERLTREPLHIAPSSADEFEAGADEPESDREAKRVRETLLALRPDDRKVLVLAALGKTGAAIGEELGTSANAARLRLMRARQAFREAYEADDQDAELRGSSE